MTHTEIRALRLALGWTQERMAEAVHVHPQTVKRWENGTRSPDGRSVALLAALEVHRT